MSMEDEQKDILIIGGGSGGYVAAIRAAQLGAKVALIEKDTLGGTCLNRGCIPTKCFLQSASVLQQVRKANSFGILVENSSLDFKAVSALKEKVVRRSVDSVSLLMAKNKITVIKGSATIAGWGEVQVVGDEQRMIKAKKVIIATGSQPASIPIEGINQQGVIDSNEALAIEQVPKSMIIIGGGVIGLEFAQIFHRMNTKVTVIEMMPQVLPNEDTEIAQILEELLTEEGIDIYTSTQVHSIGANEQGDKTVLFTTPQGESKLTANKVLVAVGRSPYIKDLGLEKLGINLDRRRIIVNERMETNATDVYAIGDVTGGAMLAHVATAEGRCAAQNAMGIDSEMDYRAVPRCIWTSPEVAAVGLTEKEARERYDNIRVGKFPFKGSGKAWIFGETDGIVKIITEEKHGQILGAHIIGPRATNLIAEATLAIKLGATAEDIKQTIHAHPTLSEAFWEASLDVYGETMHQ